MAPFPIQTNEWEQGVHLEDYVGGMLTFQTDMRRRIATVRLCESDIARLRQANRPVKIATLSEDWCVDCLMTLPIMDQIAAATPMLELRIFSRSKWPMLKEYFNGCGIMSIPVYAFLDEDYEVLGTFVERPQPVYQKLAEWKAAHPEVEETRRSATISSEEKSARIAHFRLQLQAAMEGWYEQDCQSALVAEVVALLGI